MKTGDTPARGDHWTVLIWMVFGVLVGLLMQWKLEAPAYLGMEVSTGSNAVRVTGLTPGGPAAKTRVSVGSDLRGVVLKRGTEEESIVWLRTPGDLEEGVLPHVAQGEVLWFLPARGADDPRAVEEFDPATDKPVAVSVGLSKDSQRAKFIAPFAFVASLFISLLMMLIVPVVLSSIVAGVAGVGAMKDLSRLGGKTFVYYMGTSLLAIMVGQTLVNVIRPGDGAQLGLAGQAFGSENDSSQFIEVFQRMVPTNVFSALGDNSAMLAIIFFALILGVAITRSGEPHSTRMREWFVSLNEVMMKMAAGVLKLLPYGVFALMVKVVAGTGIEPFKALLLYMLTVTLALLIHALITLPLVLKFIGGLSPIRWGKAMAPALMTAFSTSSSSMTLPVTMETVHARGRVSKKVGSFTLPLGATINMDGTALYECIGVIFLAQYYASVGGDPLTMAQQGLIVIMALMASVGAAGIPSAGLVMMLTILSALHLPLEGAALLLAVDRPLDMLRTVVNVWSDSCGAAVVARSEGEEGPLDPALDVV
ncbi:MAG: proton glutamate symport protein [Glaciecola sp.]|jgi:proton glutamate symport protein